MRKACDRCYRTKQRCLFSRGGQICHSCASSGKTCTLDRPLKRSGRRPVAKGFNNGSRVHVWDGVGSSPRSDSVFSSGQTQQGTTLDYHHKSIDAELLAKFRILFDGEPFKATPEILQDFYGKYGLFSHGPGFTTSFRNAFQLAFFGAPELVTDTFPAVESAMLLSQQKASPLAASESTIKGISAIETLRNARIKDANEALALIALGQTLAAFDLMNSASGVHLLLQYSLASAMPFYGAIAGNPSTEPVVITSIFWDTISCLARGELPAIRYKSYDRRTIDRVAGVCTTLIPLIYDLCEANTSRTSGNKSTEEAREELLDKLEREIRAWKPCYPRNFDDRFSEVEVVSMQAQANVYQQAILLFHHRIRHPLPVHNAVAEDYATSIVEEFHVHYHRVGGGIQIRQVVFPILVAAFEIEDFPTWIWETQELLQLAHSCREQLHSLVEYVWERRRSGFDGYLVDLLRQGPPFVMLP